MKSDCCAGQEEKERPYPNRLKTLIEREFPNITKAQEKIDKFANENQLGSDLVKRYYYQTANIPDETAALIAKKYGITVEWLMNGSLDDYDIIEILKAFSGVLRVETKKEPFIRDGKSEWHMVRSLYIDKEFFSFLSAVKTLQYERDCDVSLDDETFARRMDKILSHYKIYFEVKFKTNSFDKSRALEIENLELF